MNSYLITKTETEAFLGRPLTSLESKNYKLYLELATARLVSLLCLPETPEELEDVRLKALLAQLFGLKMEEDEYARRTGIQSKQVEDFRVTYKDAEETPMEEFARVNASDIARFSQCGKIRSGKVCNGYRLFPV